VFAQGEQASDVYSKQGGNASDLLGLDGARDARNWSDVNILQWTD
jgi:hypothetical protein